MIHCALGDLLEPLNARLIGKDVSFSRVSTDSRTLQPGDLFIALQGPRFDGHDYLEKVAGLGAVAALVSRISESKLPQLLVADTRVGLGRLAAYWREKSGMVLAAITGSNGKTSVKEMVAAILRNKGELLATRGNLNNDIGMPLTLLRAQEHHFGVIEMGANHIGEIDYLSRIARPDVVLINNAGRAHLEGFGTLEQVAQAKGEIINGLKPDGVVIYNGDDPMTEIWQGLAQGCRQYTFGVGEESDFRLLEAESRFHWNETGFSNHCHIATPNGELELNLPVAGFHNRLNATAAVAVASAIGVDNATIMTALQRVEAVPGRLQLQRGANGHWLVDDSYNANPESVNAAIDVLTSAPGESYLVLGALAELGDNADPFYKELGEHAYAAGISHLYASGAATVAANAFGKGAKMFSDNEALCEVLRREVKPTDVVLVKGSRSAGMERVVAALVGEEGNHAATTG